MEHKSIHLYGITPEQFFMKINQVIDEKISSLEDKINNRTPSKYISRKEARDKLHVSYVTLNDWDKKGVLKKRKIGNKVFYLNEEIDKVLEKSIA